MPSPIGCLARSTSGNGSRSRSCFLPPASVSGFREQHRLAFDSVVVSHLTHTEGAASVILAETEYEGSQWLTSWCCMHQKTRIW